MGSEPIGRSCRGGGSRFGRGWVLIVTNKLTTGGGGGREGDGIRERTWRRSTRRACRRGRRRGAPPPRRRAGRARTPSWTAPPSSWRTAPAGSPCPRSASAALSPSAPSPPRKTLAPLPLRLSSVGENGGVRACVWWWGEVGEEEEGIDGRAWGAPIWRGGCTPQTPRVRGYLSGAPKPNRLLHPRW